MRDYRLTHLPDDILLHGTANLVVNDRQTTADLLAHLAEVDSRRLYAPAGHSSMFAYCVETLHFSEDAAYKRIQAARAARQFPSLFEAVADGRLHLTAVGLLAPHLTAENVQVLIEEATHKLKSEIQEALARRFDSRPIRPNGPAATIRPLPQLAPAHVRTAGQEGQLALAQVDGSSGAVEPGPQAEAEGGSSAVESDPPVQQPNPGPSQRFLVKLTIDRATHDKLRRAQSLLSHAVPCGDVAQVIDRALDALITQLERRKAGAQRPGRSRPTLRPRHIPARIRRAVWERDRGQCTFVGADGHRCTARRFLEFDHREPVARGGKASVEGIRLRCRTHNQYEAERVFGVPFMMRKRQEAREAALGQDAPPWQEAALGQGDAPGQRDAPGQEAARGPLARDATETPPEPRP